MVSRRAPERYEMRFGSILLKLVPVGIVVCGGGWIANNFGNEAISSVAQEVGMAICQKPEGADAASTPIDPRVLLDGRLRVAQVSPLPSPRPAPLPVFPMPAAEPPSTPGLATSPEPLLPVSPLPGPSQMPEPVGPVKQ